jgi:hypothetical protein
VCHIKANKVMTSKRVASYVQPPRRGWPVTWKTHPQNLNWSKRLYLTQVVEYSFWNRNQLSLKNPKGPNYSEQKDILKRLPKH